jgi:ABC-2 type transport system permease protein
VIRAITVELLKLRRSMVPLVTTILVVVSIPAICVGFIAIARSGGAGAAALKAQALVVGEGWDGYLGLLGQMVAVAMFIGPGVVVTWAFGREHTDRTFPSLFALPVSRRSIAAAKFLVLAGWGLALTALLLLSAFLAGLLAGVGPLDGTHLVPRMVRLGGAGFLTALLALTLALVASAGRGYLPAVGALILLTMVTQIAVLFGTGGWFPYAAPGLYALAGAEGIPEITPLQLLLVPATTLTVAWATVSWWDRAEVL